ncbi:small multidrug resistance pump [Alicyclobacillus sacchari]|uniref:Small multidrug resistance pump n=1 Tax=Alicyclobacillus sacchari TaxID=392010 RepID=A0A4R8LQT2_9BACL|nr:multidrug efflux SMR transporter [Alicyclobacillus sacchari]TDY47883.1 small multidrug resistance pump [Alicyclobacillus sacchari]GMA55977.1 multidrug transporter [Alicyclobacillus sacchari]
MPYVFLAVAIASEICATSLLKVTDGFTKLWPSIGVVLGYALSFYSLSQALKHIPLGPAYAIWSGIGTAATTLIGLFVWKQSLSIVSAVGLMLIVAGVIVLHLAHTSHS